jgi:phage gp36-like protein
MGIYATTTSFGNLLPQLYQDNNIFADIGGEEMVSKMIERAEGTVNSYLSSRYSLPFSPVPPEVRRFTEDVACYYILRASRYRVGPGLNQYVTEFKSVFDELTAIRNGEMGLAYTDGSAVPIDAANTFLSSTDGFNQIFQLDDADDWEIGNTQLADIEANRDGF